MRAIETITDRVSVLDRDDVDTDQIIPKQFLKRIERSGFGEFLFHDWAKDPDWDLPQRQILVTGRNFGCGSSREHAPWALEDYGFRAIIAESFADIFRSNCMKIGLLPVELAADEVEAIVEAGEAQVDLVAQEVRWPGGTASFEIDPEIKHRLVDGLDDIALTLAQSSEIDRYEREHDSPHPPLSECSEHETGACENARNCMPAHGTDEEIAVIADYQRSTDIRCHGAISTQAEPAPAPRGTS